MLLDLLIILPFALVLAVLTLAGRRSRQRAALPAPAFRPQAPAETRYAVTVLPDASPEREPFAFDSGLIVGERES